MEGGSTSLLTNLFSCCSDIETVKIVCVLVITTEYRATFEGISLKRLGGSPDAFIDERTCSIST